MVSQQTTVYEVKEEITLNIFEKHQRTLTKRKED